MYYKDTKGCSVTPYVVRIQEDVMLYVYCKDNSGCVRCIVRI